MKLFQVIFIVIFLKIGDVSSENPSCGGSGESSTCKTILKANTCLEPGDFICSSVGCFFLTLQAGLNTNLNIYKDKKFISGNLIWTSRIASKGALKACLSADGNLAVFNSKNVRLWKSRSRTPNVTDAYGKFEGNGTFVIYGGGRKLWASDNSIPPAVRCDIDKRKGKECMEPNDVLCSANGEYQLRMQGDGNLVTYKWFNKTHSTRTPIWQSNAWTAVDRAIGTCLNFDGNLIIYSSKDYKIWTSRSYTANPKELEAVLENDGIFAIYDGDQKLWASNVPKPSILKCASTIEAGKCLVLGDILCSPDGTFSLIFQVSTGNLEINKNPTDYYSYDYYSNNDYSMDPYWDVSTKYEKAERACMNLDGNFVIYDDKNYTLWESYTSIQGSEIYAMIEDFGNFAIFQGSQRRWSSDPTVPSTEICNNMLSSGSCLELGDSMCSSKGSFILRFQEFDGHLVLYNNRRFHPSKAVWFTGVYNQNAIKACLSADGNLAVFNSKNVRLWKTRTNSPDITDARLVVEDTGILVIYNGEKKIWASDNSIPVNPPCGNKLEANTCMERDDVLCSNNGTYLFKMQRDGNLVKYTKNSTREVATWSSDTYRWNAITACLSPDGNFVMYNADMYKVWFTRSSSPNTTGAYGLLNESGNFTIFSERNESIWATDTPLPAVIYCNTKLMVGKCMEPGDMLCSPNGTLTFLFRGYDGELRIFGNPAGSGSDSIWVAGTYWDGGVMLCLRSNGKFVLTDKRNNEIWSASPATDLKGKDIFVTLEDTANLAIFSAGVRRWSSDPSLPVVDLCVDRLNANTCLKPGNRVCSANKNYTLLFQTTDGNLVIYRGQKFTSGNAVWASNTNGVEPVSACLTPTANFVIFNKKNFALWASRSATFNKAENLAYALMENDGNFTIYLNGKKHWGSGWN